MEDPRTHPPTQRWTAARFLDKFFTIRGSIDQSHAALAAIVLLPCVNRWQTLRLSLPSRDRQLYSYPLGDDTRKACGSLQFDWMLDDHSINRLLALSCDSKATRATLLSIFYGPRIECNAVTPCAQGTVASMDSSAGRNKALSVCLCTPGAPNIAFPWLGSFILGLYHKLLDQGLRFGQSPIDLHFAAWTGSVQSFIKEPVATPLVGKKGISRADKCRLLFLSQSSDHNQPPICQRRPFGTTPVADTDIDVRKHESCQGYQLRYKGILWRCNGTRDESQLLDRETDGHESTSGCKDESIYDRGSIRISCERLDRRIEVISENVTRTMFSWLRPNGCASHEVDIWRHD